MYLVNRSIVIIKGKQPLVDWINSHNPENMASLKDVREDCNTLLIPELEDNQEAQALVESNFDIVFENELEDWYEDESLWPEKRTLTMFREWFELEVHSLVWDVLEEPLEKDEG